MMALVVPKPSNRFGGSICHARRNEKACALQRRSRFDFRQIDWPAVLGLRTSVCR